MAEEVHMNEETKKSPCDIPGACAKMNRRCDACAPAAPVAQPVSEPVGHYAGEHRDGADMIRLERDIEIGTPLYAAPAAPVALTDVQWLKLWTHKTGQRIKSGDKRAELLTILRFAELAHGIGQGGA